MQGLWCACKHIFSATYSAGIRSADTSRTHHTLVWRRVALFGLHALRIGLGNKNGALGGG